MALHILFISYVGVLVCLPRQVACYVAGMTPWPVGRLALAAGILIHFLFLALLAEYYNGNINHCIILPFPSITIV